MAELIRRIVAIVLWVIGFVFLLGLLIPALPGDALTALAFFLAAYTVPSLS